MINRPQTVIYLFMWLKWISHFIDRVIGVFTSYFWAVGKTWITSLNPESSLITNGRSYTSKKEKLLTWITGVSVFLNVFVIWYWSYKVKPYFMTPLLTPNAWCQQFYNENQIKTKNIQKSEFFLLVEMGRI